MRLSSHAANVSANAVCKSMNNGAIYLFTGENAQSSSTLARLQFGAQAFSLAKNGVAKSLPIAADREARAAGRAAWFRVYNADESLVILEGSVGTANADLVLSDTAIERGAVVSIDQFVYTQSMKGC